MGAPFEGWAFNIIKTKDAHLKDAEPKLSHSQCVKWLWLSEQMLAVELLALAYQSD